jgi:tetratricopeptide (TPR) repeat protein
MRAEVSFKKAYTQAGTSLRVVQAYGNFLARNNRKADAIKVYESFLAGGQRNALVEADLADVSAGKVPPPFIASPLAGASEVLFSLAAALNTDQNNDTALLYCQLALNTAADKSLSLSLLGDILAGSKSWEDSTKAYEKIPATSALHEYAETQIALNLSRLGKNDDAIARLKAVVAANPKDSDAWTTLGGIYRADEKLADAVDAYTKAIDLMPAGADQDWRLYYYRGVANDRLKNYDKSDADFRKALQISKDEPQALNYLGYSFIDRHVNTDEAIAMVKRAVELKPNDGYILDSLAWAYYNLGDYEQALVNQEHAVDLTPSDPIIAEHLGDIYWRVGRKLEAGFQWQHAIDNHPEDADRIRIQDKLKNGLPDLPVVKPSENKSTSQPSNG